jgi:RNA polymerase sigma-70 factor, ECF subfamily
MNTDEARLYALKTAQALGVNRNDAEDIAQDVALRWWAWRGRVTRPEPWVARCVKRIIIDRIRAVRLTELELMAGSQHAYTGPSPEGSALRHDRQEAVRRAVDALPPHWQAVVWPHYRDGLTLDEIAVLLGVSEGTVKSRLARARAALSRKLRETV